MTSLASQDDKFQELLDSLTDEEYEWLNAGNPSGETYRYRLQFLPFDS